MALKLDDGLRANLRHVTEQLKTADPYVRWVRPENLHITLKFLGGVEIAKMGAVKEVLGKCAKGNASFHLKFTGIDVIPNPRYPRSVYASLRGSLDKLKNLTRDMECDMETLGFAREGRDFLPHLTIGRVKSFKAKSMLMMKIREFQGREIGNLAVDGIFLMKSELRPQGAIYTELAEFPLGQ